MTRVNQYAADVQLEDTENLFLDLDTANSDIANSHLNGLHGLVADAVNLDTVILGLDIVALQSIQQVLQRYSTNRIHLCPVKKK